MRPRRGRLWPRKGDSKGLCADSASVLLYGVFMFISKIAVLQARKKVLLPPLQLVK